MIDIPFTPQQISTGAALFFAFFFAIVFFPKNRSVIPYERLASILTPPEQHFYKALSSTLQGRALIMSKVRIADLIKVRRCVAPKNFWRHFSQISQKHIDFVLIDPNNFKTICLIELDDKSHARFDRVKRDWFVNQIMTQTGIPLYRFAVNRHYNRAEILQILSVSLNS